MYQSCTLSLLERIDQVASALMNVDGPSVDRRVRGTGVHSSEHSSGVLFDDADRSTTNSA